MKAIELLKDIRAYAKEFKYTLKPKQKFEPDMIIEGCNQALAELAERPEPTSDAVKILCKRYGTSLAKIALDLEAENKRLKDFIQQELDSMRKLVAELEKDPPMRSFTQVLKGRIARYRTVLAKP